MTFRFVPEKDWVLGDAIEGQRRANLLVPQSGEEILEHVAQQALEAGGRDGICLHWEVATNDHNHNFKKDTYFRVTAKIPVEMDLFDQLFNGRSGYCAQYYLSVREGELFNRELIDRLTPAIRAQYEKNPDLLNSKWAAIRASLKGRYSKMWVVGDLSVFENGKVLQTRQWSGSEYGSRLANPQPPQIDLKGTFINPASFSDDWIDKNKLHRSCDVHEKGWA